MIRPFARTARGAAAADEASPAAADAAAFRRTVMPHLDGAYNFACYLTRDPVLSEDVVQDAFLRAFRAFPQFRGGSARSWLFAIVRNCSFSALTARSAGNRRMIHAVDLSREDADAIERQPDADPDPEHRLIALQDEAQARRLLHSLPDPFRETLVLRELEGLSYKEIADVTGVAVGTVMSRLARARAIIVRVAGDEPARASEARNTE